MMAMFRTLREENELITQLKGMTPGHKVPMGLLREGKQAILETVESFKNAKKWDIINEKRPEKWFDMYCQKFYYFLNF